MPRDLVPAALIGTLGALCLVAGILGFLGNAEFIHPGLNEPTTANLVGALGVLLLLAEIRLMLPILRSVAARAESRSKSSHP